MAVVDDDIPRVLARNTACHQCRKRKLKCDAQKPVCTNCSKPRQRGAAARAPPEPCTWDNESPGHSNSEGPNAAILNTNGNGSAGEPLRKRKKKDLSTGPNGAQKSGIVEIEDGSEDDGSGVLIQENSSPSNRQYYPGIKWLREVGATPNSIATNDFIPESMPGDLFTLEATGSQMSWPDWPRDLPRQDIVEHVCNIFWDKVATFPKLLHKASFFASLRLPPSHHNFPATPLLHAILAVTANHISEVALSSPTYFPVGTPMGLFLHPEYDFDGPENRSRSYGSMTHVMGRSHIRADNNKRKREHNIHDHPVGGGGGSWRYDSDDLDTSLSALARFQLWHRRKAFETVPEYFDINKQVLQCVQALCIATVVDQMNAWWVDVWMEAGMCVRAAIPLRLNETQKNFASSLQGFTKSLLGPAQTPLEKAERDRTWWMVYIIERNVAISTTWTTSINDVEITVELPVVQANFDLGLGELEGVQSFHSEDLYTNNPALHSDGISLMIKALKIWTDVNAWFRAYSRGSHTLSKFVSDPTLRLLLSQINAFRLACPPHLRRPTSGLSSSFDVDLIIAHMLTHGATMCIGEPLINKDSWTHDIAKVALSAIRACLSLLYDITATSFDLTLLPGTASWVWSLCTRCLCRFMASAAECGDQISAAVFRSEVEVFRLAIERYGERYPLGQRHASMVEDVFKVQADKVGSHGIVLECTPENIFDDKFRNGRIGSRPATTGRAPSDTVNTVPTDSTPFSSNVVTPNSNNGLPSSSSGIGAGISPQSTTSGNGNYSSSVEGGFSGVIPPKMTEQSSQQKQQQQQQQQRQQSGDWQSTSNIQNMDFKLNFSSTTTTSSNVTNNNNNNNQAFPNMSFPGNSMPTINPNLTNLDFLDPNPNSNPNFHANSFFGNLGNPTSSNTGNGNGGSGGGGGNGASTSDFQLDGFEINNFSFDFDAVADWFANSGVGNNTFDGQDYVWR